jgi:peroxiredoxin
MSLKAQLDARRRKFEANAKPHVVDAARRSIQALAETGIVAQAVKAGETAPPFGCDAGVTLASTFRIDRAPVVISFFWGHWCPFCVLELKALAAAHLEIERLGATLVALSPQMRDNSSCQGRDGKPSFPILSDPGCKVASRYRIAFAVPKRYRPAYLAARAPQSGEDRIERLDIADTGHPRPR